MRTRRSKIDCAGSATSPDTRLRLNATRPPLHPGRPLHVAPSGGTGTSRLSLSLPYPDTGALTRLPVDLPSYRLALPLDLFQRPARGLKLSLDLADKLLSGRVRGYALIRAGDLQPRHIQQVLDALYLR